MAKNDDKNNTCVHFTFGSKKNDMAVFDIAIN